MRRKPSRTAKSNPTSNAAVTAADLFDGGADAARAPSIRSSRRRSTSSRTKA